MNGLNIYNVLRGFPITLTTHNVGHVDSIGNAIFLAGQSDMPVRTPRLCSTGWLSVSGRIDSGDEKTLIERAMEKRPESDRVLKAYRESTGDGLFHMRANENCALCSSPNAGHRGHRSEVRGYPDEKCRNFLGARYGPYFPYLACCVVDQRLLVLEWQMDGACRPRLLVTRFLWLQLSINRLPFTALMAFSVRWVSVNCARYKQSLSPRIPPPCFTPGEDERAPYLDLFSVSSITR